MIPHYVRKNARSASQGQHIIVNCGHESDNEHGNTRCNTTRLRCWSAEFFFWDGEHKTRIKTASGLDSESWWEWFYSQLRKRTSTRVWLNDPVTELTWLRLWEEIDFGYQDYTLMVCGDGPTIIRCSSKFGPALYLALGNFISGRICDLAKHVGGVAYDTPQSFDGAQTRMEYCNRNVEILSATVVSLLTLIKEFNWGNLAYTAAGQAWNAFRHKFMDVKILSHNMGEILPDEQRSYYGGRVECFYIGSVGEGCKHHCRSLIAERGRPAQCVSSAVYVYDVQSIYPSVMRSNKYPVRYRFSDQGIPLDRLQGLVEQMCCIGSFRVNTDSTVYPVRYDGCTIYPVGRYWTWLAGPEIALALERGAIEEVGILHCYDSADIFTGFVDELYSIKCRYADEEDRSWEWFIKLMLNGLFGKFGQRNHRWVDDKEAPPRELRWENWYYSDYDGNPHRMRTIAGRNQRYVTEGYGENACVAIPAYVTAYARVKMRSIYDCCLRQTLLYTDTDSVHVTPRGRDALISSGHVKDGSIGCLRCKGVYRNARYYNLKVYELDGVITMAGLPTEAKEVSRGVFRFDETDTLTRIIDRGPDGSINYTERVCTVSGHYDRGVVGEDGFTTPLTVYTATEIEAIERMKARSAQYDV